MNTNNVITSEEQVLYNLSSLLTIETAQNIAFGDHSIDISKNEHQVNIHFFRNDHPHRENDKPATLMWYANGNMMSRIFRVDRKIHRDGDNPSITIWYETGQKEREEYFYNDSQHRDGDKPAVIEWYRDGKIKLEMYIVDGQPYRKNGNNFIYHFKDK